MECSKKYQIETRKIQREKKKGPTRAFCLGDTRQQMTDAQLTANPKNWCLISSSKAYVRVFPSIINANAACGSFSRFINCEALVI